MHVPVFTTNKKRGTIDCGNKEVICSDPWPSLCSQPVLPLPRIQGKWKFVSVDNVCAYSVERIQLLTLASVVVSSSDARQSLCCDETVTKRKIPPCMQQRLLSQLCSSINYASLIPSAKQLQRRCSPLRTSPVSTSPVYRSFSLFNISWSEGIPHSFGRSQIYYDRFILTV